MWVILVLELMLAIWIFYNIDGVSFYSNANGYHDDYLPKHFVLEPEIIGNLT